jgi:hypothetical protein
LHVRCSVPGGIGGDRDGGLPASQIALARVERLHDSVVTGNTIAGEDHGTSLAAADPAHEAGIQLKSAERVRLKTARLRKM